MFSFHKPKIYRSSLGCCICKAKSSSSRFTDSQKYEAEFERCFRIEEKRSGEICNACVLLVKRWKKLSPENRSSKHWHHVVDARAGPGTKLNTNRRLINNGNNNNNHGSSSSASASGNTSGHRASKSSQGSASEHAYGKSDVMPLSLSQSGNNQASSSSSSHASTSNSSTNSNNNNNCNSNNQASTSHSHSNYSNGNNGHHLSTPSKRTSSYSKALAIDTNVSTFTFGEPRRKTYGESYNPYATQHLYPASSYASMNSNNNYNGNNINSGGNSNGNNGYYYSNSTFTKPQSALSSSAFESVMKRFRQRQQQQQLRAQKRQQQRSHQQGSQKSSSSQQRESNSSRLLTNQEKSAYVASTSKSALSQANGEENDASASTTTPASVTGSHKRTYKRSESSCSVTQSLDGFRVNSVLDSSIWKKERTCCGTIFRGLNSEVAIFPKLFKPCEHRMRLLSSAKLNQINKSDTDVEQVVDECENEVEPSPRTIKSGSISSCGSATSGTGSMEQGNFESSHPIATSQISPVRASRLANSNRARINSKKNPNITSTMSPDNKQQQQRSKTNYIPTIATRSQRGRSNKALLDNQEQQQQQQQSDDQQLIVGNYSDEIASTTSTLSHVSSNNSASSNSMLHMKDQRCHIQEIDEDDDTGDDAEIVEELEDDDDDDDVDEEDLDEELEGSELTGQVDAGSELGAGSSSLMVDEEENSTDASCSVESLVGGARKATVG